MKKYLPNFIETLIANILFWAIIAGVFYFTQHEKIMRLAIFVGVVSILLSIFEVLILFFKKKRLKILMYLTLGIIGIILLTAGSFSLLYAVMSYEKKKYIAFGIFLVLVFVLYYKFDKLCQSTKKQRN